MLEIMFETRKGAEIYCNQLKDSAEFLTDKGYRDEAKAALSQIKRIEEALDRKENPSYEIGRHYG